jgi:hypothetical protein
MKIILKESQYRRLLSEDVKSDNKVVNQIRVSISDKFDKFIKENKEYLDKSKNILDIYSVINQFKDYLIKQSPIILQQLKTGKGGDVFANETYSELYRIIQGSLNGLGWGKRQFIKTLAPGKDELLKQMKSQDISIYISTFKSMLDAGFLVGWMDETAPYNNNVHKWSGTLDKWVDTHQNSIKNNLINLIVNKLYK